MTGRSLKFFAVGVGALGLIGIFLFYLYGRAYWVPAYQTVVGKRTVADVVKRHGEAARSRLSPYFAKAAVAYPPDKVSLLALKDSARLELWAETDTGSVLVREYSIQALSGQAGPKLREGDGQVPEGLYRVSGLNPNSAYHLSMKLDYPNAFDLRQAKAEGRTSPGSNIFIHGKAVSVGCLAMGDRVIEELFVLAADIGRQNIEVAIAPRDPRLSPLNAVSMPVWVDELYAGLNEHFSRYRSDAR